MIVDVHVHMGMDEVFDKTFDQESLIGAMDAHGVDVSIVQPGTRFSLADAREEHDAIAQFVATRPGQLFGMANPNPHLPQTEYRRELHRCVRELGFVGVKINTVAHAVGIDSNAANCVYEAAQELDIPVMIHTGSGNPQVSPLSAIAVAQRYPGLRLVLAHAGSGGSGGEALMAAKLCPNIYLETSWSTVIFLTQAVASLGGSRLMLGSDHPENLPVEIVKHRASAMSGENLCLCLGETAARLFRLPERAAAGSRTAI